jgi:benzoyl-CoA-dihydrodiol lyase
METLTATAFEPVSFATGPGRYRHWKLSFDGPVATLTMDVPEDGGLRPGYELKLNSYDLGVDIELADATQRIRFEHPEVRVVAVRSAKPTVFCAGANIYMLGSSTHAWKVNFCKITNETRCGIEDASANSGIRFVAALTGTASGGGYELALACDEIHLIDDGNSAVSLPEVPLLGVLPGTGGLTRLVDKRKVRRDRADVFCTIAEGIRGNRAKEWGLVDAVHPRSKFEERLSARLAAIAAAAPAPRAEDVPVLLPSPIWNSKPRPIRAATATSRSRSTGSGGSRT